MLIAFVLIGYGECDGVELSESQVRFDLRFDWNVDGLFDSLAREWID
jgi:hypothetical protein